MTRRPQPPPSVTGPEAGEAKPSEPGPVEPPGIAASILPQRKRDAARHPKADSEPPEPFAHLDDIAAAEQNAVEAPPAPKRKG